MLQTFSDHVNESQLLDEALITFGGKSYPKFGNIVILAGGAGSGKGFIKDNLIGMEGKVIDVDEIKKLAIASTKFAARIKSEIGQDIKTLDLRKPENVSIAHNILGSMYKTDKKLVSTFNKSVLAAAPDRKPNIIMDVTLKEMDKLRKITSDAEMLGYEKKNIHLVWIVNDVEVAKQQNLSRSRVVPVEILMGTHVGAAKTMKEILSMGKCITRYLDGDIVLAFNKFKVDATLVKGKSGGQFLKDVKYVYVKRTGKGMTPPDKLSTEVYQKIKSYVPAASMWESEDVLIDGVIEMTEEFEPILPNIE